MTSGDSFDSNAVEANGISIEIEMADQRIFPTKVYAVPKNQMGATTPVKLAMRIVNKTSTTLRLNPYQPFIPELLASDGQTIQRLFVTNEPIASHQPNRPIERSETREFERWKIPPGIGTIIPQTARLFWRNNCLQLQIPTSPVRPNNFWLFDALQPGTYQLRFVLNIDRETTPVEESKPKELETGSRLLATPWVNLRLVEPIATDSSAIEIDGVQFKAEMPETVLTIPPNRLDAQTPVKLGIRVTNNTSTALRFEQIGSLDLTLIGDDGEEIQFSDTQRRLWVGKGPNYYLAQPGENALFVSDGTLDWHLNQLVLAIPNKAGGNYLVGGLQPGTYQLQLIYHVLELRANYLEEKVLEKVWNGWIAMPFVEFRLVEP